MVCVLDEDSFYENCQRLLQRSEELRDGWSWEQIQGKEGYLRKTALRSVVMRTKDELIKEQDSSSGDSDHTNTDHTDHTNTDHTHTDHTHTDHTHTDHTDHTHADHTHTDHTDHTHTDHTHTDHSHTDHTHTDHTHADHTHTDHTHTDHTLTDHTDHTHADHTHTDHTHADHTHTDHTHTDHTHTDHTDHTHTDHTHTDLDGEEDTEVLSNPAQTLSGEHSGQFVQFEYHVTFSSSYRSPVMYFRACSIEGKSLSLEEVWSMIRPKLRLPSQDNLLSTITQQEHPLLGQPFFMLHPCRTEAFMRPVLQAHDQHRPVNYVLTWLSVVAPLVSLDVPLEYCLQSRPAAHHNTPG